MSNEYDYSGLYDHTNDPSGTPDAGSTAQNSAPQQNAYPNVGSSGMNTANTARTDYSTASQPGGSANAGTSYTGGYTAQSGSADSNGYTSSFSGGGSASLSGLKAGDQVQLFGQYEGAAFAASLVIKL